jgi:hypothetical protein
MPVTQSRQRPADMRWKQLGFPNFLTLRIAKLKGA